MNKSIFFFDIDNTLLFNKIIPDSAINSLKKLKELGHYIFIATGRPEILVKPILKLFDFDGCIVSNGGACYINGEKEFELFLNKQIADKVIKEVIQNNDSYSLLTTISMKTSNPNCEIYKKYLGDFPNMEKCDESYHLDKNIKSVVIHPKDLAIYQNKFKDEIFLEVNKYGYELLSKDYTKGTACKYLSEKLNVCKSYAFGDEINDISMFECVDVSVAMGNACDELKQLSTFVTTNVDDNGIEYALKNILKVIV